MDKKVPTSLVTCNVNATMHVKPETGHIAHTQKMLGTKTAVVQKKPRRQKALNSRGQNIRINTGRRAGEWCCFDQQSTLHGSGNGLVSYDQTSDNENSQTKPLCRME